MQDQHEASFVQGNGQHIGQPSARLTEFAIALKRQSGQLVSFVDVLYGAFLSYFFWVFAESLVAVDLAKEFEAIAVGECGANIFRICCMSFMFVFIIEDFRDMKLVTGVVGYYKSSFRFFLDVLIVLALFVATVLLKRTPPSDFFIVAFSSIFFLGSGWGMLLTKNRHEVPISYSLLIIVSHISIGLLWLLLYWAVHFRHAWFNVDFRTWRFLSLAIGLFGAFYAVVMFLFRDLRRKGIPVDDIIEMFPIKILRGLYSLVRSFLSFLRRAFNTHRFVWKWYQYTPPARGNHFVVEWDHGDHRPVDSISLSDFVNMHLRLVRIRFKEVDGTSSAPADRRNFKIELAPDLPQGSFRIIERNPRGTEGGKK